MREKGKGSEGEVEEGSALSGPPLHHHHHHLHNPQAADSHSQDCPPAAGGKTCAVCGDIALAHNFGVLTCETCKAFFRRNALKPRKPRCTFSQQCVIVKQTRRHCPACRLDKCLAVGMKPQMILDDEAKKARKEKRQEKRREREQDQHMAETASDGAPPHHHHHHHHQQSPLPQSSTGTEADLLSQSPAAVSSSAPYGSRGSSDPFSPDVFSDPHCSPELPTQAFPSSGLSTPSSFSATSDTQLPPTTTPATAAASPSCPLSFIDAFLQQTLDGSSPSSSQFNLDCPVAVQYWACPKPEVTVLESAPPASAVLCQASPSGMFGGDSTTSTTTTTTTKSMATSVVVSQGHASAVQKVVGETGCPTCGGGGGVFRHVLHEDLPSDMQQYWSLSQEERLELTHLAMAYQNTMMKLSERQPGVPAGRLPRQHRVSLQEYMTMLDKVLHLCVRFAKQVPEFARLQQADQISILKASSLHSYGIVIAAIFVVERNVWLTMLGEVAEEHLPPTRPGVSPDEFMVEVTNFCRRLKLIAKNDITLYSLLHCIVLFDPRERGVDDRQWINRFRDKYVILLKHYLESEYSFQHADRYFSVLMDVLVTLHSLGSQESHFLKQMKIENPQPLTAEMLLTD
ncbi:uncharacterized protein LOC143288562 [Babylonia areolata]|uniref:uncharacterized protein LOC143288562 n=1 Tax=Babylonia areolata TaxID=304850 RepID=UPI003FD496B4